MRHSELTDLWIHPHLVFELLAYTLGFQAYLWSKRRNGDVIGSNHRWSVITAAALGAAIGSKLLAWLNDPVRTWELAVTEPLTLLGGKTIVGALIGGWIAVELTKRMVGVRQRTGDLFAIPLCISIAIGRIGCFLTGLSDHTYGVHSDLPWAVDFGDGPRHPTQLYEMLFLLLLALGLSRVRMVDGRRFRGFLWGYLLWRLLIDFIKPDHALGMSGIQWACLCALAYLSYERWHEKKRA